MKVITPDLLAEDLSRADGVVMKTAFNKKVTGKDASMGIAVFASGVRSPMEGEVSHKGDEYSYVLRGSLRCVCNGEEFTVRAGDFAFIPSNTNHYSYNPFDETAEVLWILS
ncbi:MAG: cupin domain-containing protein [Treponema sp.]|nr:cupin domain-containing protein [Treponema sp.]